MYKLTKRREDKALTILVESHEALVVSGAFDVHDFERKLRDCWGVGYHELYAILDDACKDERWRYVAVYYMERIMPALTMELRSALAKAYGMANQGEGSDWQVCRKKFWDQSGISPK